METLSFFFFFLDSQCAPVFAWREGTITRKNGEIIRIQTAMEAASIPVSVVSPRDFSPWLNSSAVNNIEDIRDLGEVTLAHAIATYVSYVHTGSFAYVSGNFI